MILYMFQIHEFILIPIRHKIGVRERFFFYGRKATHKCRQIDRKYHMGAIVINNSDKIHY